MGYPVAIVVYFPTPTDYRETTERRATELFYKISLIFHTNLAYVKKKVYLCGEN